MRLRLLASDGGAVSYEGVGSHVDRLKPMDVKKVGISMVSNSFVHEQGLYVKINI